MNEKKREAYILITTDTGREQEAFNIIQQTPEVKEAHTVLGVYDLIIRVESDSLDELKQVIKQQIRGLEYVRSTLTMIVAEERD